MKRLILLTINFIFLVNTTLAQWFFDENRVILDNTYSNKILFHQIDSEINESGKEIEIPYSNPLYFEEGIKKVIYDNNGFSIITDSLKYVKAIEFYLSPHSLESRCSNFRRLHKT